LKALAIRLTDESIDTKGCHMTSSSGRVSPADFPPPIDVREEFVKRSLDAEDERIEIGVAIVGGGTAGRRRWSASARCRSR
jgi:hypothetical protein